MSVIFNHPILFQGVIIDACVLGPYATLLSQGADITGGIYLRPPQISGLLQYLLVRDFSIHTYILSLFMFMQ